MQKTRSTVSRNYQKIVGKTTWDVIEQYKEDVPADIDSVKDQLNDESDSLK